MSDRVLLHASTPLDALAIEQAERSEWLQWRRGGLGGSDIAGVLGLSPWSSPWSVWADKVINRTDDRETDAMEFGRLAEPLVRTYFERRTGLHVRGEQARMIHPDHPWARITLDGWVADDPDALELRPELGTYEAKTTSDAPWDGGVPPIMYQCQGQWGMGITGAKRCWFGVLHFPFGRVTFRHYLFERDDSDIAHITDRARRFWFDHVTTGIPPAVDDHPATADAIAEFYNAPDPTLVLQADPELVMLCHRIRTAKATIKDTERVLELAENDLKARIGNAVAIHDGTGPKGKPIVLATWKQQTRTGHDWAAFCARFPHAARRFATETTFRVLRTPTPPT